MRAALVVLVLLLTAGAFAVFTVVAQGPSDDGTDAGPASVSSQRPLDPEGPWVLSAQKVRLAPGNGLEVELSTPVTARADQGPADRVVVLTPEDRPLVGIGCGEGACELRTPLGVREVPAGSLAFEGAWHQGRLTGLRVEAVDGAAQVTVDAFGPHGVRVAGSALEDPVTVTGTLVLEGDPRDVDRVALRGPDGEAALAARPGDGSLAALRLGDRDVRVEALRVTLLGDPLTDETVTLRLWIDGDRTGFIVKQTPADAYGRAGAALSEHLILRSPTRDHEAELRLTAGPVVLEGPGQISPRFDASLVWTVANASAYERGWLLVDDAPKAEIALSGEDGPRRALHATLPGEALGPDDEHALVARLERDLAPGVVQVHHTEPVTVRTDHQGPPAPTVRVEDDRLTWTPTPGAVRWEATARPEGDPWRELATDGTQAPLPTGPAGAWEGRVRGVDALGNPGPWSETVHWTLDTPATPITSRPQLVVETPDADQTLTGLSEIRWQADPSIARVKAALQVEQGSPWRELGSATTPPMTWDTRTVPDGTHRLKVTALGPGGRTTRILPVTVDNLEPVTQAPSVLPGHEAGPGAPAPTPLPGHPLPRAIATGLLLAGAGLALTRAGFHRSRGATGRDK